MSKLQILTDAVALGPVNGAQEDVLSSIDSDTDSLFDETVDTEDIILDGGNSLLPNPSYTEPPQLVDVKPAQRRAPPIPGLYFDPDIILPDELAEGLLQKCLQTYFRAEDVNQVMLFERVIPPSSTPSIPSPGGTPTRHRLQLEQVTMISADYGVPSTTRLPPFLTELLGTLSKYMRGILPQETHELLFPPPNSPPKARQVIINLYRPGEGITPHVDLLDRFDDGIIGVSLGSGCVMLFKEVRPCKDPEADEEKASEPETAAIFLPHGSVYVMSGKARYEWMHGIDGQKEDWVQDRVDSERGRWVMRSIRVSITFRWLLPGADMVGGLPDVAARY
ncbi:hypothetical protein EIP86_000381 [Pleurotus ostreatoroseus]|nr:hypothetical protein EIP86_000381 [Pleurotus ostreatoroseus]